MLGDAVVDTSLESLRARLEPLLTDDTPAHAQLSTDGPPAPPPDASSGPPLTQRTVDGGRRRRQVTVLFADVVGFTALSEHLDVEDVSDAMNALWSHLDQEVLDHGGRVDKHIGDALMAVWGTQLGREDDAEQAVRCALAMQTHLQDFADRAADLAPQTVRPRLRIGINTGPVLVTPVGLAGETTAMGDAVNTASRIESAAAPGEVLIGRDTYRLVRGVFTVREREEVRVKGKQEPLATYVVEALRPRAFRLRTRGLEGVETRMVGRTEQLAELLRATETSRDQGALQVRVVEGEAGVGKSRLHDEYRDWLELHGPVRYFLAAGSEQMRTSPYGLLRDLLAFRFEVNDDDSPEVARAKLLDGVADIVGPDRDEDGAMVLGHLAGWGFDTSPVIQGLGQDATRLRARAAEALQALLIGAASHHPVVMVVEDLHWADDASLELLARFVAAQPAAPITLVALSRPDLLQERPGLLDGPTTVRLRLELLGGAEIRALVTELLRLVDEVPERLLTLVESRSGGNPYFAEEIVAMLIEARAVVTGPTRWVVDETRFDEVRVPLTVTEVVTSRMDRLGSLERGCLEAAAVLGLDCWDTTIAALLEEDLGPVDRACTVLEERELLLAQPTSSIPDATEFAFRHAITREVAYDAMLRARRSQLHRSAARWIEQHLVGRGRGAERTVAVHYELGGEATLAGRWFRRAGEQQETRSALTEALGSYERAIELGAGLDRQRALVGAGRVAVVLGRPADASTHLAAAVVLGRQLGDDRALLAALAEQGRIALLIRGERDATWVNEGLAVLPRVDDALTRVRFLRQLGTIGIVAGDHDEASARLEEALAIARPAGLSVEVATLANNLAHVRTEQGRYDDAIELADECRRVAETVGNLRLQMGAVAHLGFAELRRGNHDVALVHFETAQEHNRRGGDREQLATVGVYLALCRTELGDHDLAHAELLTALRISLEYEVVAETVRAVAGLARLAQRTGDPDRARELAALVVGHPACSWEARHSLAELLEGVGEPSVTDPATFRRVIDELLPDTTTDRGAP
ncbi:MAG: AAA family ATPase [Intrasporangiaceae bacterium]|nr:AAA family ATPase [Intrasporangiaceae bacterium]